MKWFSAVAAILLCLLIASPATARAETWPDQPVKIIVGFSAGGGTDIIARILADKLTDTLGQRFIVENRVGASGSIATEAVVRSPPDGYTVLISATDVAINRSFMRSINYDVRKDLAPITLIGWTPLMIVAHPALNVSTLSEFIALLRSRSGQLNYASPSLGSPHHLAGEYLKRLAGVELVAVHYRGIAPAIQDVVAGHVPIAISGMPPIVELIKSGRLRAIAVTGKSRSSLFPNIETLAESGVEFKDFDFSNWFGLFAPAGVPASIQVRLHNAAVKALTDTAIRGRIAEQGVDVVGGTQQQFATFLHAEVEKYAHIIKRTGVGPNQ